MKAKAVFTLGPYRFYNLLDDPFFEQDGGRMVYFEGTFAAKLSAANVGAPRYNCNNLMYKQDLSDPRLEAAWAK